MSLGNEGTWSNLWGTGGHGQIFVGNKGTMPKIIRNKGTCKLGEQGIWSNLWGTRGHGQTFVGNKGTMPKIIGNKGTCKLGEQGDMVKSLWGTREQCQKL